MPGAGPGLEAVQRAAQATGPGQVQLVDITPEVAQRLAGLERRKVFSEVLSSTGAADLRIGAGDSIEISVWEAPPASLFGGVTQDPRTGGASGARATVLPEQMIGIDGMVNVPFAGRILAAGRTPAEVEGDIVQRLGRMAHQPQALVRVTRNVTHTVTVVGEVPQSVRMPLTPRGERVLDALAAAGGVRQPVSRMSLQLTRDAQVLAMPLDALIADPRQNILLRPGDVVTALHQPFALTVLGAAGQNTELSFETQGISLAQALARAGGLQDARADPRGVFVFRFEDAIPARSVQDRPESPASSDRQPVVYRLNLSDAGALLLAQGFSMRHRDILYVANAPAVELQKFLNLIGSVVIPYATVRNLAP